MMDFIRKRGRSSTGFSPRTNESPSLAHRKQRIQNLFTMLVAVILVAVVTEMPSLTDATGQYDIDAESIASQSVVAEFAFESENLDATREEKELAAARVPNTWKVDSGRVNNQMLTLQQRITSLRDRTPEVKAAIIDALMNSTSTQSVDAIVDETVRRLATEWKADTLAKGFPEVDDLVTWLRPDPNTLPKRVFEADNEENAGTTNRPTVALEPPDGEGIQFSNLKPLNDLAEQGLQYALMSGIKQQGSMIEAGDENAADYLIIERSSYKDLKVYEERPIRDVPDTISAREQLRIQMGVLAKDLQDKYEETFSDWERLERAAFELAKLSLTDTLAYDLERSDIAKVKAREDTEAVMKSIEANQMLQEANYQWTKQSRHDVQTYWKLSQDLAQKPGSILAPLLANFIIIGLIISGLYRAVATIEPMRLHAYKSVNIMLLIIVSTLILGRILTFFEPTGLLVPITASAVLLTILTNARLAALGSLIITLLLAVQYGQDWRLVIVNTGMCFTGVMSIYRVRKRRDMTSAIVKATVIGGVAVIATTLTMDALGGLITLRYLALVAINGLICSFLVPGLLSPLERLFGVTTDIQLLEYSDLNNHILNKLAMEVPATYAHSLMMGQLAETACDAIGANGLLARVCAYYHDIGKSRRPEYFIENQTGYNIHDDMSPRLSARAIASHVTEGVEMAREYHLPQPIIRGILEHHGTTLISFFYKQATDQAKHGDVREEDFRYPGPKPQSRETAVLMICDAVESGVRTIKNPNEDRVRDFIDKIIQARSADRQFDECDLTLKQLDTIREVLISVVLSTHHSRISYPERPRQEDATNVIPMTTGGSRS